MSAHMMSHICLLDCLPMALLPICHAAKKYIPILQAAVGQLYTFGGAPEREVEMDKQMCTRVWIQYG